MVECPRCGRENPEDARFCSSCGTRLDSQSGREERKFVSILFIDLVGFTSRSDQADPEDVRDVLRLYHSHVRAQIERFGGTVEKFIGDAVMAVFGAPIAHTDDPERAVRAGLRSLETVDELNQQHPRLELAARAAVNTGEAVVSVGDSHQRGEALALGDVVNTASRLQTSAPPGGLVVGQETYEATRSAIHYEQLDPVTVKGKSEVLPLWQAIAPLGDPADCRMRATRLVGRERELTLLESMWDGATSQRRPHLVTVVGPPGIGKSRLAREFGFHIERSGGRSIRGRCLPYDTTDAYGAFTEQVREIAGIFDQDSPEESRTKLVEAMSFVVNESERSDIVRSLSLMLGLGLDEPTDEQIFLLFAARRFMESLGDRQPTLFVFDDVHWADTGLLDLIEYLATHARDTPVMFLALARPELFDRRTNWGSGMQSHTTISLDPVSHEAATTMVASLGGEGVSSQAIERLVEVAEGNPLFLEELTTSFQEGADLERDLPTTVRAAIAGRVDALPAEHRAVLLSASVVGKAFWPGALAALGHTGELLSVLDDLEVRDLIRRKASSRIKGEAEFGFKHILIRDVCYSTLPRSERRRSHAQVAGFIQGVGSESGRELAWLLAHHYEEAGEPEKAIEYLLLAADRAQEAMAQQDTMRLYDKAISLADTEDTRTQLRLLHALAQATFEDFDAAYDELSVLIPELEGKDRVEALLVLARADHWTERTTEMIETSKRAIAEARELGLEGLIAPGMARLSQAFAMRGKEGDLEQALQLGEEALEKWTPDTRADELAEHQHLLADQHYWTGSYSRAMELSRAAHEHAEEPSSAEALLRGGGQVGLVLATTGRYEEAFDRSDAVIASGRELGRPVRVLLNYSTLALRETYDLDEARRRSEESLATGTHGSFHMPWMNAEVDLIQTDVLDREFGSARARWDRMWDDVIATQAWERWLLGGKLAALRAEIALGIGDLEDASVWADKAIEMAVTSKRKKYESVARRTLGQALMQLGDAEKALGQLRAAVTLAEELGNPTGLWRAKVAYAATLRANHDDEQAGAERQEARQIIQGIADSLSEARRDAYLSRQPVLEALSED